MFRFYEDGVIHGVWTYFLPELYSRSNFRPEEVSYLPKEISNEGCAPHIHSGRDQVKTIQSLVYHLCQVMNSLPQQPQVLLTSWLVKGQTFKYIQESGNETPEWVGERRE